MHRFRFDSVLSKASVALGLAIVAMAVGNTAVTPKPTNFSFIHVSDEHSNDAETTPDNLKEMARLSKLPSITLEPYKISVPPPSFIISTGDITEFGPVVGDYDIIKKRYAEVGIPFYGALGNHDCSWGGSLTHEWTRRFGAPYYSIDRNGCHFVLLNSPGLLDGRPNLSPQELDWLKADLAKVGTERPVFIGFHHPLDTNEYSSQYETDQLLDILRPYNIALIMVGHGHSAVHSVFDGYDVLEGGSAYGPSDPGFQVVSIVDSKLRIAYKLLGQSSPSKPMLEKQLYPHKAKYPEIKIQSPKNQSSYDSEVIFKVWTSLSKDAIAESYIMLDGKTRVDLNREAGGCYQCRVDDNGELPGGHYARVCFKDKAGTLFHRSTSFFIETDQPRPLWRAYIGAASRSTPSACNGVVFVGGNDGRVHAFDAGTGKPKWVFKTGGAVAGQTLAIPGRVIFGSEDENVYCVSASDGKLIWKFHADQPVYTGVVTDGTAAYFGTMNGTFYGITLSDGKLRWKDREAEYNIQVKPFLADGKLYYTSWDSYIYCQDTTTGWMDWKCMGEGSAEGTAYIYVSPAKVDPVVCGDHAFAADQRNKLTIVNLKTGKQDAYRDGITTVGISENRKNIYLLRSDGNLFKVDSDLKETWTSLVSTSTESGPVEYKGVVYLCSTSGLVSAIAADTGKIIWRYQANPSSYVLCSLGVSEEAIYVTGNDGHITALRR